MKASTLLFYLKENYKPGEEIAVNDVGLDLNQSYNSVSVCMGQLAQIGKVKRIRTGVWSLEE